MKNLYKGFCIDSKGTDKLIYRRKELTGYWVTGSYVNYKTTTYCFKEDGPAPQEHFIVYSELTDWGLPNKIIYKKVIPESVGQFFQKDIYGKDVFEGDWVQDYKDDLETTPKLGQIIWDESTLSHWIVFENSKVLIHPSKHRYIKLVEDKIREIS